MSRILDDNQCNAIKEIINRILGTCFEDPGYGKTLKYYQEEHNALQDAFRGGNNGSFMSQTISVLDNMEATMLRFTDSWITLFVTIVRAVRATKIDTQQQYNALVRENEAINAAITIFFSRLVAINSAVSTKSVVNMPVSLPTNMPVSLPILQRCSLCNDMRNATESTISKLTEVNTVLNSEVERYKLQINLLEDRVKNLESDLTAASQSKNAYRLLADKRERILLVKRPPRRDLLSDDSDEPHRKVAVISDEDLDETPRTVAPHETLHT